MFNRQNDYELYKSTDGMMSREEWEKHRYTVLPMKRLVTCLVCGGAGQLSHQHVGGCMCCDGKGVIPKRKAEALRTIRRDLSARLQG